MKFYHICDCFLDISRSGVFVVSLEVRFSFCFFGGSI